MHSFHQFLRKPPQGLIAQHLHGALVHRQRVVERHLVVGQVQLFRPRLGVPYLFGDFDQLINHLRRGQHVVLVSPQGVLQHLRELFALDQVFLHAGVYLIAEDLLEQLQGQVFALHALRFLKKLIGKNGDIRLFDPGGGENINHFTHHQGPVNDLPDGGLHINIACAAAFPFEFHQPGLHRLEKSDLLPDGHSLGVRNRHREGPREQVNRRDKPLLALFQAEDVFLGVQDQCHLFPDVGVGGEISLIINPGKHVDHHIALLQHGFHRLFLLMDRRSLAAVFRVGGHGLPQVRGDADVIHHQAGGLVLEHPVDAGYGLHQIVVAHHLVNIQSVQAGGVKPRQPHVPHDHQSQRVFRVLKPLPEELAILIGGRVFPPL